MERAPAGATSVRRPRPAGWLRVAIYFRPVSTFQQPDTSRWQ
jgi:hypothetical protein